MLGAADRIRRRPLTSSALSFASNGIQRFRLNGQREESPHSSRSCRRSGLLPSPSSIVVDLEPAQDPQIDDLSCVCVATANAPSFAVLRKSGSRTFARINKGVSTLALRELSNLGITARRGSQGRPRRSRWKLQFMIHEDLGGFSRSRGLDLQDECVPSAILPRLTKIFLEFLSL